MKLFANLKSKIGNAVRNALGKTPLPAILVPQAPKTELQQQMAPFAKAPQWFRLLMLYRITKRQYRRRKIGMSAKSPERFALRRRRAEDGIAQSRVRLGRATGPNSYGHFKAEQVAARVAKRLAA